MDSAKDIGLKNILFLWRSEVLYNLFKEEDIGVEDLKLIKYRHVCQLLQSQKMGVRIRFEHYLEKWRNQIGLPLKYEEFPYRSTDTYKQITNCQIQNESPAETVNTPINGVKENIFNTRQIPVQNPKSPKQTTEILGSVGGPTSPETEHMHTLRSKTKRPRENSTSDTNLSGYLTNPMDTDTLSMPFNLPQILRSSGTKGSALIKYYEQYKEFKNVQRVQLVQLICDYFNEHEYHLSLNLSYDIEEEIVQMFPTEKLHYYRTDKRGKIYTKYTNMKTTKRKAAEERIRNAKAGRGEGDLSIRTEKTSEGGNREINVDTISCDSWSERAEVHIKTEDTD